jgi:hypothetical protein
MTSIGSDRELPIDGPIPRLSLTSWESRYGVVAGITGRGDGFNLGLLTGEPSVAVMTRWRTFAAGFPEFPTVALGLQVHGTRLAVHRSLGPGLHVLDAVDGHVTRTRGVLLTVTVADCVPIYLVHPRTGTLALLHAGWRGVAAGMLECGLRTLADLADGTVDEVVMHCGVSICGECYQVGREVSAAVTGGAGHAGPLDLRRALAERGAALGVRDPTASSWCAAHDAPRFFSHRASGGRDGRMVAYLGLPSA